MSDRTGRVVNTSLADYVVAANADVRDVDVLFVGQPDSMTPLGTKGVGELAIAGQKELNIRSLKAVTVDLLASTVIGASVRRFFACRGLALDPRQMPYS